MLFITTKNLDYLRNVQEIELLRENYQVEIVGSYQKSYIRRLVRVYSELFCLSMRRVDEVFIGFAPQLILPFWGWKLKKKKVTIDFFISMYDTFVFDRKKFKKGTFTAGLLRKLDERTLCKADCIIADTKEHGKYFSEELHADPNRIRVLYLNADQSIYYPREQKKPEKYKNRFVVLYFGSILPLQGVEVILGAIELLREEKGLQFEIIGPLSKQYSDIQSDHVACFSWLEQEQLAEHIAYADLCLAGHFNDQIMKAKRTIPGKAYIYHAMKKDMILGDNPANHELYHEGDEGIFYVPMGSSELLAQEILKIKKVQEIKQNENKENNL